MASTNQQLMKFPSIRHALIISTLCIAFITMVQGKCPEKCTCSSYTTTCVLARLYSLPEQLPRTTQFLRMEADNITELNAAMITRVNLQNLTRLLLHNVHLQNIEPGAFKKMKKLKLLEISNNNITVLKKYTFAYLDSLHLLDLSSNNIMDFEDGAFSRLPNIRYLDISYNYFSEIRANSFVGMGHINNCTMVDIPVFRMFLYAHYMEPEILRYMCTFTYFSAGYLHDPSIPQFVHHGMKTRSLISNIPGIIFKNTYRKTSGMLYLDMQYSKLRNLRQGWFQNLVNLTYLDLSFNEIATIESGTFEELISLRTLILAHNDLQFLNDEALRGLRSITILDISHCKIETIESGAFIGLTNLRVLKLPNNELNYMESSTFSSAMLKELDLQGNVLLRIDKNSLQNLRYIKSVSNDLPSYFTYSKIDSTELGTEFYKDIVLQNSFNLENNTYFELCNVEADQFLYMDRLDSCSLIAEVTFPKAIQMLKSLHFYIDVTSVESTDNFRELFLNTRYIKELQLTLININTTTTLVNFFEPQVSTLNLIYSDIEIINNITGLSVFPSLKYLLIDGYDVYSIKPGAFNNMPSLKELTILYSLNAYYEKHSFHGLHNLEKLTILSTTEYEFPDNKDIAIKCVDEQVFLGLKNLKQLILSNSGITCINPGAFQGLQNIERIDISQNYISAIISRVFGAECVDNFTMSCKNVTLTEYCNSTNALKSLILLDLSENNISYIHPYAFISCINLHTLYLESNKFLTLREQFLFTPGLKTLHMSDCGITRIPANTFLCSPLVSDIFLNSNQNITQLPLETVLPLRNLEYIVINPGNILCNCDFYKTWIWLREHRVFYLISGMISENMSFCGNRDVDEVLSLMNCSTYTKISNKRNVTKPTRHDFALFKLYIEPTVLIIIFILGLISNMFLLFVALRHSDMRTKHNVFIIHLAIVDVLSLTLNLPLSYWDVLNIRWEFDDTTCKIFIFSKDVLVAATVFSIICLGVERFLVAKTFKNLKNTCISRIVPTTWLLFMTWLSAVVLSLPAYFSATVEIRCLYCPPNNQDYIRNVWTFQMIMYCLLPAAVLAFLNIKASMFLRESVKRIPGELKNSTRAQNRITVANIVLVLIIIFIISYLPNYTLRVLVAWSVVDIENVFLGAFVTYCFYFFITVFNPISVFIMSTKFKSHALSYFSFHGK